MPSKRYREVEAFFVLYLNYNLNLTLKVNSTSFEFSHLFVAFITQILFLFPAFNDTPNIFFTTKEMLQLELEIPVNIVPQKFSN